MGKWGDAMIDCVMMPGGCLVLATNARMDFPIRFEDLKADVLFFSVHGFTQMAFPNGKEERFKLSTKRFKPSTERSKNFNQARSVLN